jgi:16S rRNA (guanine(966)-N(2))-methyltransferase RsmD
MNQHRGQQIEYRIIAGQLKGKKIATPDLGVTRPPLTRLRRSIFDFLGAYLPGATYLDLYSGTGSYLFEAVSRGADRAVGIEQETALADAINGQAEKYAVSDSLTCLCEDVLKAVPGLSSRNERFDIIMMAPPQYHDLVNATLKILAEFPLSSDRGMIICQHDSSETDQIEGSGFEVLQRRKYGNTTFTILRVNDE